MSPRVRPSASPPPGAAVPAETGRIDRERDDYHALQAHTLTRGDEAFVHQHVVDAWTAQHATPGTKPIGLCFALVGLYLHVERGFTGREVHRTHRTLAKRGGPWPRLPLPEARGAIGASDVMRAPPGAERDRAIDAWCAAVWRAYAPARAAVIALLETHGIR